MVWNCSIIAATLLFGVSGKSKAFGNESKTVVLGVWEELFVVFNLFL